MHAIDTDNAEMRLPAGAVSVLGPVYMPREYIVLTSELVGKSDIRAFGRRWSLVVSGGFRFGDIGRRVYLIDEAPGTHPFLHVESAVEREIRRLNEINDIQHERLLRQIRPIADATDAACPACSTGVLTSAATSARS
jgi:hypothetical protein